MHKWELRFYFWLYLYIYQYNLYTLNCEIQCTYFPSPSEINRVRTLISTLEPGKFASPTSTTRYFKRRNNNINVIVLEIHVSQNLLKPGGGHLLNVRDGRAGEK